MAEESNAAPESQALNQGLVDLRQTWEHLARELASGVPELPGVIDQELAGLHLTDLNEETLIRVTEAVVARVAAAGFPDEASVLLRRMGRAMYELLLLLATQEEIRDMKPPALAPETSPPQLTVLRPTDEDGPDPFDLLDFEVATEEVQAALPEPEPSRAGNGTSADSAGSAIPLPEPAAVAQPLQPRDPVRPAASGIGKNAVPAADAPAVLKVAPAVAPARTPPAAPPTLPLPAAPPEEPSPVNALPTPVPTPPPVQAQAPPPPPPPPPPPSPPPPPPPPPPLPTPAPPPSPSAAVTRPPAVVVEPAPVTAAPSQPRELTEEDAPLWGFDPTTRDVEAGEHAPHEPASKQPDEPAAGKTLDPAASGAVEASRAPVESAPLEPSPVADSPPAVEPPPAVEQAPRSGWTVRLSPRRATEQERKLAARELEMPPLIEEIVLAARVQQDRLSARGNARRVLAAAKERPALAATADPAADIKAMLEAGQLEEAATLAMQMALTSPGDDAAAVICAVGEEVRGAKHLELAVLCFTTAVLTAPPCDRACWQLCTLSVERRDAEAAPIWLEFVARLLRAQGHDLDAISVYRQLLKLAPRRHDIRELLRVSSLTGQLPD